MNKVFLIGNLTREPELTETSGGVKVCRFSIAVNRPYTTADGERKTDFFNCIAWRGLGESVSRYAHKGNKVAVTGSIEIRNYEDSEGNKRTAVDIIAQEVEFLSPKEDGERVSAPAAPTQNSTGASKPKGKTPLEELDDDTDIPF